MIDCRPMGIMEEEEEEEAEGGLFDAGVGAGEDPELGLLSATACPDAAPTADVLSPKEQAVLQSIDAEYDKKKAAGQIAPLALKPS